MPQSRTNVVRRVNNVESISVLCSLIKDWDSCLGASTSALLRLFVLNPALLSTTVPILYHTLQHYIVVQIHLQSNNLDIFGFWKYLGFQARSLEPVSGYHLLFVQAALNSGHMIHPVRYHGNHREGGRQADDYKVIEDYVRLTWWHSSEIPPPLEANTPFNSCRRYYDSGRGPTCLWVATCQNVPNIVGTSTFWEFALQFSTCKMG